MAKLDELNFGLIVFNYNNMDKKNILLIGAAIVAIIILIVSFINFSKKENTQINNNVPTENNSDQIISDEQTDLENGVISSTTVNLISDQQIEAMAPEKKEEVLNMRVATPENIETVTGIKEGSKTAQPVIENGIIVGVPTGGPAANTTGTGPVTPTPSYQDEFEAIRNQKK